LSFRFQAHSGGLDIANFGTRSRKLRDLPLLDLRSQLLNGATRSVARVSRRHDRRNRVDDPNGVTDRFGHDPRRSAAALPSLFTDEKRLLRWNYASKQAEVLLPKG